MKRIFALALLGLVAFVGCNNEEGAAPADNAPAAGAAPAAPGGPGEAPGATPAAPGAPAENP